MIKEVSALSSESPFQVKTLDKKIIKSYEFATDYYKFNFNSLVNEEKKDSDYKQFIKIVAGLEIVQVLGYVEDTMRFIDLVSNYNHIWIELETRRKSELWLVNYTMKVVESNHEIMELEYLINQ